MKTIVLHVPDEADEATVMAALAELLDKKLIEMDTELPMSWPGPPLTAEAYADKLGQALAAPRLSVEDARKRLGL
jgi:hypothetical protein